MTNDTEITHTGKRVWTHLCFHVYECSCGKTLFATDQQGLRQKVQHHEETQ